MSTFTPAVEEIRFALRTWAGLEETADAETIDHVLHAAGRFAAEVLAPLDAVGHRDGCALLADGSVRTPAGWGDAYAEFVKGGWNTVHFPSAIGGQGLPIPV